ncbi:helix-turn-helix domain-containing protein [Catenovulum sediminis]|uniref:LuxR C-terminal-related transcriptional regulator n=1 Tax=Catenovulum sediminis TaxID=1740262 RepID=A0ABV1RC52_9ALTE
MNVHSHNLSKRETEVVELILLGLTNKAIAEQLYVSERTVKFHCSNVYEKMRVSNRLELILELSEGKTYRF